MSFLQKLSFRLRYFFFSFSVRAFAWKNRVEYVSFFKELYQTDLKCMKLVATFPSFQPRHHLFKKNTKFIGCCLEEEGRLVNLAEPVKYIFEKYPAINPVDRKNTKTDDKILIYISMGTIFSVVTPIYVTILEAIKLLNNKSLKI